MTPGVAPAVTCLLDGLTEFQKNTLAILHAVQRDTRKPTKMSGKLRLQCWMLCGRGLVSTDARCGHGHYEVVREYAKRAPTLFPKGVVASVAELGGAL